MGPEAAGFVGVEDAEPDPPAPLFDEEGSLEAVMLCSFSFGGSSFWGLGSGLAGSDSVFFGAGGGDS